MENQTYIQSVFNETTFNTLDTSLTYVHNVQKAIEIIENEKEKEQRMIDKIEQDEI